MKNHNQRGFASIVLLGVFIAIVAAVSVVVWRSSKHKTTQTGVVAAVPSADSAEVKSKILKIYDHYNGTLIANEKEGSTPANYKDAIKDLSKSSDVTANVVDYLANAKLYADPVICAQNISTEPFEVSMVQVNGSRASAIVRQAFGGGLDSGTEIGLKLVKVAGDWKLDQITCVPPNAQ